LPVSVARAGRFSFSDEVDVGQRGGAGDEIAPQGGEMVAGFEGGGDFGARGWPTFVFLKVGD
jgi:hypothetical protein